MEEKHISGATEEEVWQQLNQDLTQEPNLLTYQAHITQGETLVILDIDIDLGGGFESGFATTIFSSHFNNPTGFSFDIGPQHFTDSIGKALGMQDAPVGHSEFDNALIIKTNDETRIRGIFTDSNVRATLLDLPNFTFEILVPDGDPTQEESVLELVIEAGITDPVRLRQIYRAFMATLHNITN